MILSDEDIQIILDDMNFETDDKRKAFSPEDQIRPCSIDLRLDRRFWVPLRSRWKKIDFVATNIGRPEVEGLYRRRWLEPGEKIVLKPGDLLLGRTYEKFTIPNGYAGKLEGRSTFARLGLSIHCTGDFINPGWRGKMPLQLVNHGKVPIVLTPYIDICQLLVINTSGKSIKEYGADELKSKYMNEEGEPSRYWMDARLNKLKEACGKMNLEENIRKGCIQAIGDKDQRIVDRFVRFLNRQSVGQLTSSQEILERFAKAESKSKKLLGARINFFKWLPFALFTTSIGSLFKDPIGWGHYALWAITGILIIPGIFYMFIADAPGEYFLERDLPS